MPDTDKPTPFLTVAAHEAECRQNQKSIYDAIAKRTPHWFTLLSGGLICLALGSLGTLALTTRGTVDVNTVKIGTLQDDVKAAATKIEAFYASVGEIKGDIREIKTTLGLKTRKE